MYPAGTLLAEDEVEKIENLGIDEVKVRTALTCATRYGICAKCYGRDLGRGNLINQGEAVGVIAAQSIGEPGTQLTMRTFHIGGAVSRAASVSQIEGKSTGIVRFTSTMRYVTNARDEKVVISRNGESGSIKFAILLLIDILPLEINLIHVKWSGFGVWADLGEVKVDEIPYENNTIYFSAGQIMFYPGFESMKELLIPYDSVAFASKAGLHSANHFATIKNPQNLSELGRRAVEDGKQPVIFEI